MTDDSPKETTLYTTEEITAALQDFVRFLISEENEELAEALLGLLADGLMRVGGIKNDEFVFGLARTTTVH